MTTDYRAICAELLEALRSWSPLGGGPLADWEAEEEADLMARAENALAQSEPEEPSDDKLMDIARATNLVYYMGEGRGFASPYVEEAEITAEVLAFARAVLARYGGSTSNPTEA